MRTINPNDSTAHLYDLANYPLKNEQTTIAEVKLIQKLAKRKSKILDIGCGTGRHAIPLQKVGFRVTGIDSSKEMIEVLKSRDKQIEAIVADILSHDFAERKFDLITLFWNAFNEIALTKNNATLLFKKMRNLLAIKGKILINIDNPEIIEPEKISFQTSYEQNDLTYTQSWHVKKYYKATRTTDSLEKIKVLDESGKLIEEHSSLIRQRWWNAREIAKLASEQQFTCKLDKLKINRELYLVLEKR